MADRAHVALVANTGWSMVRYRGELITGLLERGWRVSAVADFGDKDLAHLRRLAKFVEAARMAKAAPPARFFRPIQRQCAGLRLQEPGLHSEVVVEDLNREGVVAWRGFTDPAVVERAMRAAAAVVLPSSYAEGVPRTLIEAAAAGAPIITDTPGCRDTVIDQVSGFLCALGAPAELAAVMARLLDEPHLIVDMGRAGRALAVARFDRRIVIEQTVSLYEEQLRRARR